MNSTLTIAYGLVPSYYLHLYGNTLLEILIKYINTKILVSIILMNLLKGKNKLLVDNRS